MAKYHTLIFETILLNYTGPSVDKPLLFSFVFLFGGGELFKMSKMIFCNERRELRSAYRLQKISCINYLRLSLCLWPPAEMKKKKIQRSKKGFGLI